MKTPNTVDPLPVMAAITVTLAAQAGAPQTPPAQPVFRTGTTAVMLDIAKQSFDEASVRRSNALARSLGLRPTASQRTRDLRRT